MIPTTIILGFDYGANTCIVDVDLVVNFVRLGEYVVGLVIHLNYRGYCRGFDTLFLLHPAKGSWISRPDASNQRNNLVEKNSQ